MCVVVRDEPPQTQKRKQQVWEFPVGVRILRWTRRSVRIQKTCLLFKLALKFLRLGLRWYIYIFIAYTWIRHGWWNMLRNMFPHMSKLHHFPAAFRGPLFFSAWPGSHTDKFNCESMDHCSTACSQAFRGPVGCANFGPPGYGCHGWEKKHDGETCQKWFIDVHIDVSMDDVSRNINFAVIWWWFHRIGFEWDPIHRRCPFCHASGTALNSLGVNKYPRLTF